jgi:hypothetical protein
VSRVSKPSHGNCAELKRSIFIFPTLAELSKNSARAALFSRRHADATGLLAGLEKKNTISE